MHRILIVEDDPAILQGLETTFAAEHFDVTTAADGAKGLAAARRDAFDAIILDIMLPGMNGLDVCKALRSAGTATPILMLTSKTEEMDKVLGLELGADDYVTKPFGVRELVARVRALIRRRTDSVPSLDEAVFGDVVVDLNKQNVMKKGAIVHLSAKEFNVLKYFVEREGRVVTREMLLDDVWGYEDFPTTRTVDNVILSLRKKLENNPAAPAHFLTVHAAGYRFVK